MTSCIVVLLQAYIPEKSILYVDLTDTEQNNIDDAFGMMHEKVYTLLRKRHYRDSVIESAQLLFIIT